MSLRIISGNLKRKKLHTVQGTITRPTADRIRESLFNILASDVKDAVVLDLFAGTGALGIEALSRGARSAVFIDHYKAALLTIKKNAESCHLMQRAQIIHCDIVNNSNCVQAAEPRFNLVFMDPPYDQSMIVKTLYNLHISRSLQSGAKVVIEHSPRETVPEKIYDFQRVDQRKYGKTLISFMVYTSPSPET